MLKVATFALVQAFVTYVAVRRGGAPERLVAAMLAVAFISTMLLPYHSGRNYDRLFVPLFMIDAVLLVGLTVVALVANRFWPMWAAALQLDTLAIHAAKLFDPQILPLVYARASGEIGYGILALLVAGVVRHGRRVDHGMSEADWSFGRNNTNELAVHYIRRKR